ncbi:Uncharacterised protein [Streptococcus pneumoniae]|nr:Uncharacterised protein [Streptococcus pneumoniae]
MYENVFSPLALEPDPEHAAKVVAANNVTPARANSFELFIIFSFKTFSPL